MNRLLHDCCFAIASRSLDAVKSILREEEWGDFVNAVMAAASEEIRRYEEAAARQQARLRPANPHELRSKHEQQK